MAIGTRSTGTFEDGLHKLLQDIATMKTMPDADMDFVYQLETMVVQKIREPHDQLAQLQAQQGGQGGMGSIGSTPAPGGDPMAGLPPALVAALQGAGGGPGMSPGGLSGPPGLPPGMGGGPGAGPAAVPGVRNAIPMPNPDDFQRLMQRH